MENIECLARDKCIWIVASDARSSLLVLNNGWRGSLRNSQRARKTDRKNQIPISEVQPISRVGIQDSHILGRHSSYMYLAGPAPVPARPGFEAKWEHSSCFALLIHIRSGTDKEILNCKLNSNLNSSPLRFWYLVCALRMCDGPRV